jgi:hypothetical protein
MISTNLPSGSLEANAAIWNSLEPIEPCNSISVLGRFFVGSVTDQRYQTIQEHCAYASLLSAQGEAF